MRVVCDGRGKRIPIDGVRPIGLALEFRLLPLHVRISRRTQDRRIHRRLDKHTAPSCPRSIAAENLENAVGWRLVEAGKLPSTSCPRSTAVDKLSAAYRL